MVIIGIDPGKRGAAAILHRNGQDIIAGAIATDRTTPAERGAFIKHNLDGVGKNNVLVFIEDVHAMPKQGVRSMFTFGQEMGFWLGVLASLGIEPVKVAPQKWQNATIKGMAGKTTKERAIRFALAAFPGVQLSAAPGRKPHDGIADALCIAYYGMMISKN